MRTGRTTFTLAVTITAAIGLLAMSADAAIVIVNQIEGFRGSDKSLVTTTHNGATQVSYDATGVDKLVVAIGTESGFNNQKVTSVGVSFNGVPLTLAVQDNYAPPGSSPYSNDGGYAGIFYLDNPFQGAANFSISTTTTGGGPNGGHVSILGLAGTANGFGNTAADWTSQTSAGNVSTSITTSVNDALVIAMAENSGSNNGSGTPNVVSPLALSNNGSWGNNWGGAASGYQAVATSGTTITPTFSTNAGGSIHVVAAEFEPWTGTGPQPDPATLMLGSRTLVSENNANFNISVFDGKARYDNAGTGQPLVQTPFGDGTVEDYNFIVSRNGQTDPLSYASGGAGLTPDPYDPNPGTGGYSNNNGQNWANVWTTSDPDTETKDFISGSINTTHAGHGEVQGTVDISGLASGTLYFPHGTYINQWSLTLEMTGDGQPTLTAVDAQTSNGPGTNYGWITDFSFTNPDLAYDTITYTYLNADLDGSRARFMGVVLDGQARIIPEPATTGLLALAACGLGGYVRRRRRA